MKITEQTKQNAVNSDLYVEEKQMSDEIIYDKTNDFYKIESVNSVSTLYDININTNYTYDTIKFANNHIKELHLIYSNDYEQLLQDNNLIEIDSSVAQNLHKDEIIIFQLLIWEKLLRLALIIHLNKVNNNYILNLVILIILRIAKFNVFEKIC